MQLDKLMENVAKKHGINHLVKNNNQYYFTIEDSFEISCFTSNAKVFFYTSIKKLPNQKKHQQKIIQKLLKKYYGLISSQRISVCLDPESDEIGLLSTRASKRINENIIEQALSEIANNYEFAFGLLSNGEYIHPTSEPNMIIP